MLTTLLRIIPPDTLVSIIKHSPKSALEALQKLETYATLGDTLTIQQQVYVETNVEKLGDYFKTEKGKERLSSLAEDFVGYVNNEIINGG